MKSEGNRSMSVRSKRQIRSNLIKGAFGLAVAVTMLGAGSVKAQVAGDFRTAANGNWNSTATWERYNGSVWQAGFFPTNASANVVTILNGNTVTVTAAVTNDQVSIAVGGEVLINNGVTWTISDGSGTDLTVNGTLSISGTLAGTITPQVAANGTVVNAGSVSTTITTFDFNSGSLYRHNQNGGTIPDATWNANSTGEVIGVTTNVPSGLNQTFGNFIWNCTNQSSAVNLDGNPSATVGGNFTVASTGTGSLAWIDSGASRTVAGNLNIQGGTFIFCTAGISTRTLAVNGNLNLSGGTFDFCTGGTGALIFNLGGNYNQTGGTFQTTSGVLTMNFTGANKTFTRSSGTLNTTNLNFGFPNGASLTLNNDISVSTNRTLTVSSGATLNCGTNLVIGLGTFTLAAGGSLGIGSVEGIVTSGATGNIQTSARNFNPSGIYIYNGTAAQVTGSALASADDLTIGSLANITLSGNIAVSGRLTVATNATLNADNRTITLSGAVTPLVIAGTFNPGTSTVIYNSSSGAAVAGGISYYNLSTASSGDTFTLNGDITVSNVLTMGLGTFNGSTRTITLPASGTPLVVMGTFNPSTSTVQYTSASGATVAGTTYHNLTVNGTGTFSVAGNLSASGNVTLTSGTLMAPSGTFSVAGNWSHNGGDFVPGSGTVTFNGTGAQVINGIAVAQTFNHVILAKTAGTLLSVGGSTTTLNVNNLTATTGNFTAPPALNVAGNFLHSAGTFTAGANLNLGGNWTNNLAGFTANGGTVTFTGTTQAIAGSVGTTFNTLTISNSSTTTAVAAPTVTTFNLNADSRYIQTTAGNVPGATRNFAATSTYEVRISTMTFSSGISFGDLTLNYTSGTLNAGGNLTTVQGNLRVQNGGAAFQLASTQNPTVNIAGDLIVDAGALNFSSGSGAPTVNVSGQAILNGGTLQPATSTGVPVFRVAGNWLRNGGAFVPGSGAVQFNGSSSQIIGGSVTNTFGSLTINNGAGVSLTNTATVTNTLTFSTGVLTVAGTNQLVLTTNAVVSGAGSGRYVNGSVRKAFATGTNQSFAFPVGDAHYAPVSLTGLSVTTAGNLVAKAIAGDHPQLSSSGINPGRSVNRYWTLANAPAGIVIGTNTVTFNFAGVGTDTDVSGDPLTFGIERYAGSWTSNNVIARTATSATTAGISAFGDFAVGSQESGGFVTNLISFNYADRTALIADGWSFWATNVNGVGRNTEITDTNIGPAVVYNPLDNPGVLRIPVDNGFLLLEQNDSRNSLFRSLPANWISMRLTVLFAPTQNFQEANLMLYQDDDDFVWIGHSFSGNERVRFGREFTGLLLDNQYQVNVLGAPLTNVVLRLDRDQVTDRISGMYSADGTNWIAVGNFSQSFPNPRLAIYVGGSPSGFPNCDLIQLEVVTSETPVTPTLLVQPQQMVFNAVAGQALTNLQGLDVVLQSLESSPVTWTITNSAPSWLATSVTNGSTPGTANVSVNTTGLTPGTYQAVLNIGAPGAIPASANVTLIVNPTSRVEVATWRGGKSGAMSVSTDDSKTSGYFLMLSNGFQGTFMLMQGDQSPVFTELHQAGMELGAHSLTHPCVDVGPATIRGEFEGNIAGILASTPASQSQIVSFAWPCGVSTIPYHAVAADYFLSARGYNFNQLEETTPGNFMNLKSFNSHEHAPFPPADLKSGVDAAIAQGKWFNLVLHNFDNDDGAIAYAATNDVWVAPIGTVVKYIHQRNRTVITNYTETADQIQFNAYRLPLYTTAHRNFEAALATNDVLTFQVNIEGFPQPSVSGVFVNGVATAFTNHGDLVVFNAVVTTNSQPIILDFQPNNAPVLPSQTNRAVAELTTLVVTNTATDVDIPAQPLTYTLVATNNANGNAVTNVQFSANGIITWTPTEAQGPGDYTFTTVVTDVAAPALSATNSFTVTVNEINVAPVLPTLADRTVIGSVAMTATNTATDSDVPANSLSYTLAVINLGDNSAVLNAAINANGIITWTPTAEQWATTNRFTTIVTDTNEFAINAANLSTTNTFIVVARPYPLSLPTQANQTVNELTTLHVTNTALVVADLLGGWLATNTISFNYPDREALLADGWSFLATATNGAPRDTEVTNVSVGLIAYAQTNGVLGTVMRVPCDVGDMYSFANNTTNSLFRDVPTNWISARVRISFTTSENYMQAYLGLYQDDDNYVQVGLGHINSQKILFLSETAGLPADLADPEVAGTEVSLRLDRDISTEDISAFYSLDGTNWVPLGQTSHSLTNARLGIWTGAALDPYATTQFHCDFGQLDIVVTNTTALLNYTLAVTNTVDNSVVTNANINADGIIAWTPDEIQGPGVYTFTTTVADSHYNAANSFTVTVNEVNVAPVLTVPANTNLMALSPWSAFASATDEDVPANNWTFDLVSGPSGLTVATNGLIEWTPGANQGNSNYLVEVRVTDSSPLAVNATALSTTNSFTIVVSPVLFVTANNTNRNFDQANPAFSASYSGFVNGDDADDLAGALEFSTTATNGSPVGVYPIQVTGVSSSNYAIVFVDGTLTITPASATVNLLGLTQVYDGSARVVTAGTTPEGLTVNITYNGSASAPTNVGSYEVIGTVVDANYVGSATNTLVVVSPDPIVLSLAVLSPGEVVVSWNSVSNLTYRLQYKNDLNDAGWADVSPDLTATGPSSSITNSVGSQPHRFYQIYMVP